jgi:hypothetical protein
MYVGQIGGLLGAFAIAIAVLGTTLAPSGAAFASQSEDPGSTFQRRGGLSSDQGSPPASSPAVDEAVADLANRLGVDPSTISVASVQDVTWRDSSLGCPEPDRAYALVLRDGQRIVLTADGTRYEYHTGGGPAFYCANPVPAAGE